MPAVEELLEDLDQTMSRSRLYTLEEWNKRPWHRRIFSTVLKLGAIWL
jgi:cardiolipin synthase